MLLRRCALLCLLVLCALAPAAAVAQTSFKTVVVFGDSLSDTGNIAHLTQSQYKLRYPSDNPVLGFNYTDGRFTDGTDTQPAASTAYKGVWVEQLATLFGTGVTIKDSLDGGTDYAFGDATTGPGTTTESRTFLGQTLSITLDNMGQQVTNYLATNPLPNSTTLYVLWGGGNDLLQAATSGQDPVAAAQTAVNNELGLVQRLMAAGATNFILPNLPPLSGFAGGAGSATAAALNTASAAFAQDLTAGLNALKQGAMGATLNLYQPDVFTLFAGVSSQPALYGFGNISAPAQGVAGSPDTYLVWDGLHPTTTGHHLAAAAAANLLSPLVASSAKLTAPAAVLAGSSVTATVAVASATGGVTPTGLVTLFNHGNQVVGSAALDATGTATVTFTPAAGASNLALSAVYAGDVVNSRSASAVQPVAEVATAVATTTTLSSSATNANLGASVTLTATVTPSSSSYGLPAGTVTFLDGTATLGTGTLSNGVATYTTSALGAGTHAITATYAGMGLFAGSTSGAVSQVITAPGFTAASTPASLSIASGGSGTVSLTASSLGGYTGTITLSCGPLPSHFACAFSPASITANIPLNNLISASTLTVATNAATTAALLAPERPGFHAARVLLAALGIPGVLSMLLFGVWSRRRGRVLAGLTLPMLLLSLGLFAGLLGCGGSNNNAAPGTYTVPVVFTAAASGGTTPAAQTVNLSVTVH